MRDVVLVRDGMRYFTVVMRLIVDVIVNIAYYGCFVVDRALRLVVVYVIFRLLFLRI